MITIPQNDNVNNYTEQLVNEVLNEFKTKDEVRFFWNKVPNKDIALEVGHLFASKGYYVNAIYFVESWKGVGGLQQIVFSKKPLRDVNARLIYSERVF